MAEIEVKPLKDLPGSYGLPFFGALVDRLNLYWFQGDVKFFQQRIEKHKTTVFRVNFAPGPPGYPSPKGIALLDHKSFQVMLDSNKVDKRDTFFGSHMPNVAFTGGFRTLPYLDAKEEKHAAYKNYLMQLLKQISAKMVAEYHKSFEEVSAQWDSDVEKSGKAEIEKSSATLIFNFLIRTLTGYPDPTSAIGKSLERWAAIQFGFVVAGTLPHLIEELTFHSFPLPYFLAKSDHQKLSNFFRENATEALDLAQNTFGLDREETVHQLLTCFCMNARTGLMKKLPVMVYYLAKLGPEFQSKLAAEVRSIVDSEGGIVSLKSLERMHLLKSTVLEAFRLMPSTFFVYARAREDLTLESHEAKFKVNKGELLGAHWYFVLRDPKVFTDPQSFLPERFMGDAGEALMDKLIWSNGMQNEGPTGSNKQCPAKDLAVSITCLFVVEMLLKYDSFDITTESFINTTAQKVFFKSLKKRPTA